MAPRLRRLRFSLAQVWSYTSTETPGYSRSSRWTASSSSRGRIDTPFANGARAPYLRGSSVTTTIFLTPSAATCRVSWGTSSTPSTCWPPVIATASLYSSLYVIGTLAATAARIASAPE